MATCGHYGAIAASMNSGGGTPPVPSLLAFNPAASHVSSPSITYLEGNRHVRVDSLSGFRYNNFVANYSPAVLSGQRYFEIQLISVNSGFYSLVGLVAAAAVWPTGSMAWTGIQGFVALWPGNQTLHGTDLAGVAGTFAGATLAGGQGDVIGVVVDYDAWTVAFYINGNHTATITPPFGKQPVYPAYLSDRETVEATIHGAVADVILVPPGGALTWI